MNVKLLHSMNFTLIPVAQVEVGGVILPILADCKNPVFCVELTKENTS